MPLQIPLPEPHSWFTNIQAMVHPDLHWTSEGEEHYAVLFTVYLTQMIGADFVDGSSKTVFYHGMASNTDPIGDHLSFMVCGQNEGDHFLVKGLQAYYGSSCFMTVHPLPPDAPVPRG